MLVTQAGREHEFNGEQTNSTILDHPQQQQYTVRLQRNSRTETDQLRFHMVSCMHHNKYPITPVLGCGMGVHWQFRLCSTFALIVCVCQCCAVCISWFNYGWYSQNTVQYNLRLHWIVFWESQPKCGSAAITVLYYLQLKLWLLRPLRCNYSVWLQRMDTSDQVNILCDWAWWNMGNFYGYNTTTPFYSISRLSSIYMAKWQISDWHCRITLCFCFIPGD